VTEVDEKVIFTVRPTLLFIKLGYVLAALAGIALIALIAWQPWVSISFLVSLPFALALLLIPAFKHLKRNMLRYTLTDSKIEIDEGLISRTTRNIPLRNIQDVTVSSTISQRLLRFGNLVIDNASETGGTTVLRNIPDPRRHADLLLRELRRWH
jgi:membrane protein YdbS with pleckstrin-like domain